MKAVTEAQRQRHSGFRDFDDLLIDADASQDNDDEMDSLDSDYDDRNLRISKWLNV